MFNIVGLDVSESQLEQGGLILKFYITVFFLGVGVKSFLPTQLGGQSRTLSVTLAS
jgi:hypothetical protein